jgi:hypothetical protein
MAEEKSSFGGGDAASPSQNKPTNEDQYRSDEYGGKYKDACDGMSEAQKFGTDQIPVKNDPLPAKNLQKVGG